MVYYPVNSLSIKIILTFLRQRYLHQVNGYNLSLAMAKGCMAQHPEYVWSIALRRISICKDTTFTCCLQII